MGLRTLAAVAALTTLVAGCSANLPLGLTRSTSPYESYVASLQRAGLDVTALGLDWTQAGERALVQATTATLPFRETGYFPPETPTAAAYRLDLQRGRRLVVNVAFDSAQPGRLFVDLFQLNDEGGSRRVASLDAEATLLTYDVERDGAYVLRIQPELLRGGRFTLTQRTLSTLAFPVQGLTARAIQSGFGASRDAGTRGHEGVDIFADKGTAVVAVTDGVAQTDTNGLGGNVVWLQDGGRRRTFYYAHLDRWAIDGRAAVSAGDVLGYVGNTGNARTTSPHLHFGIYERGAIDPMPFLQPDDPDPPPAEDADRLWTLVRIVPVRTDLRAGPARSADTRATLDRATLARVAGVTQRSLRVVMPDRSVGYVDARAVTAADAPLRRQRLVPGAIVRERPVTSAPAVVNVAEDVQAEVLGTFGGHTLVRLPSGAEGWVDASG